MPLITVLPKLIRIKKTKTKIGIGDACIQDPENQGNLQGLRIEITTTYLIKPTMLPMFLTQAKQMLMRME